MKKPCVPSSSDAPVLVEPTGDSDGNCAQVAQNGTSQAEASSSTKTHVRTEDFVGKSSARNEFI